MRSSFADDDLVLCVLTYLPDFQCLASTILTSKSVYNIFQQHPRSIIRSVAYNLVGPALPQALRFVRCRNAQQYSKPVGELLGEDNIQRNPVLSSEEITGLVAISSSIQELECVFSRRMKDRRYATSQLSSAESTRFQRAMYRLCLFSIVYGLTAYKSAPEANSNIILAVREARKLRKGFFGNFPTPELREIQRVGEFLRGILARTNARPPLDDPEPSHISTLTSSMIYHAPDTALKVYEGVYDWIHDLYNIAIPFFEDFITEPLVSVLLDRNEPRLLPVGHKHLILDEVIGEHDRCSQCQSDSVQGLDLWGPNNWRYHWSMRGTRVLLIVNSLKGNLSRNHAYEGHFSSVVERAPTEQLIAGLFECKIPAYDTWNKEDWLCRQCLETFIHDHLHVWYLNQKVKGGHLIPDNCFYGYNCTTQAEKYVHAKELNHLCEPTKGYDNL
ncbi:uncharacterized protein EDB91DRAFT_1311765 [Suillus paluster]|uniref:uncharacterized protein n=1 Tax=Suillus paluster TaxID=48578 RepID=UPI001B879EFB|nr:uncharacterized protein EDB91DRAFT_1311765 [Suillus paluster]KAG1748837.1 hypothetical protein EDB91DRAFT_1311765 [Suillus paluster]